MGRTLAVSKKKKVSYDKMKEFIWKAISTWYSCDDRNELACTHRQWEKNGKTSKLDYILGSKLDSSIPKIQNRVELCSTWDHYPVYAVIQERRRERRGYVQKKKEESKHGQDGSRVMNERELNPKRRWHNQKKTFKRKTWRQFKKASKTRRKRSFTLQN